MMLSYKPLRWIKHRRLSFSFATHCFFCLGLFSRLTNSSVIVDGPKFISQPVNQSADLGAALAVLTCNVDSNPPASIEWTPSGSPVPILARSSQLTFSPVTRDSVGTYTCTATVNGYAPISADVQLSLNGWSSMLWCSWIFLDTEKD